MNAVRLRRHDFWIAPQNSRVLLRPFIPAEVHRITSTLGRVLGLTEEEVAQELAQVLKDFEFRHRNLGALLLANFQRVQGRVLSQTALSEKRKLLLGALFSGEYALESAAIFNPSIVPHPDQSGVAQGAVRFLMSLRATGEGHISSIEFRTGIISPSGELSMDPISHYVTAPEIVANPSYKKKLFSIKLAEMGFDPTDASLVMAPLGEIFTLVDLTKVLRAVREETKSKTHDRKRMLECIQWLADSNYELHLSEKLPLSEQIIYPVSSNETNGMEDARFVRFVEDDGSVMYYATYTAYNGRSILPQFIETLDFINFRILTLNGARVQNKGMALFPRRIGGRYAMLSRHDDENLFLMYSDSPYYWADPQLILRPAATWESVKIGNCGSPIETEEGWLVITHGVGPMRRYCIGAALLDLDDPSRVIGRLREPLLSPGGAEREGYVPNVVYSCGSMVHGRELILPFAVSDLASTIVSVPLDELLATLKSGGS
jgi:predicted GH43/DUF377 family glycosyl hydrolase